MNRIGAANENRLLLEVLGWMRNRPAQRSNVGRLKGCRTVKFEGSVSGGKQRELMSEEEWESIVEEAEDG